MSKYWIRCEGTDYNYILYNKLYPGFGVFVPQGKYVVYESPFTSKKGFYAINDETGKRVALKKLPVYFIKSIFKGAR